MDYTVCAHDTMTPKAEGAMPSAFLVCKPSRPHDKDSVTWVQGSMLKTSRPHDKDSVTWVIMQYAHDKDSVTWAIRQYAQDLKAVCSRPQDLMTRTA